MEGTIKRVDPKMYGFIAQWEWKNDVFFHESDLVDVNFWDLNQWDKVTFEIWESPRWPKAINVKVV